MTYEVVRAFAGSWMMLFMMLFFVGAVLWVFRPGARQTYRDTADIVFRNEDAPAGESGDSRKEART